MLNINLFLLRFFLSRQFLSSSFKPGTNQGRREGETHLISWGCHAEGEETWWNVFLPFWLIVKIFFNTSTTEEKEILFSFFIIISTYLSTRRYEEKEKEEKEDERVAPERNRSAIKARKGATPVPGPIMINGIWTGGNLRIPVVKRTERVSPK